MAGCLAHGRHRFPRPREALPPPCVPALPAVPCHRGSRPALSWLPASRHSTGKRGSAFPSPHWHLGQVLPSPITKDALCTTLCFSLLGLPACVQPVLLALETRGLPRARPWLLADEPGDALPAPQASCSPGDKSLWKHGS